MKQNEFLNQQTPRIEEQLKVISITDTYRVTSISLRISEAYFTPLVSKIGHLDQITFQINS